MKNVIKLLSILLLANCVMFTSCKKDPPKEEEKPKEVVKVTGVTLSEKEVTREVGDEFTLTPTVVPADAADKTVTWWTDNDTIATVDPNGKVKIKGKGTANITVRTKDGDFEAVCKVTGEYVVEENFEIEVIAGLYVGENLHTIGCVIDSADYENVNFYGSTYTNSGDVKLRISIKNKSGKVIPAGTPYMFKFKRNGQEMQAEIYTGAVIPLDDKITKDIAIDGTYILYEENPFHFNQKTEQIGNNEFCVEILQVGKTAYPSSSLSKHTKCCTYQLKYGN